MAASSLTPQEYELHLKDLRDKLVAYLERGEGRLAGLHKEAEAVLTLADEFREVYERYPEVEGMVADMLARERQQRVVGTGEPAKSTGCMLGWLFGRKAQ